MNIRVPMKSSSQSMALIRTKSPYNSRIQSSLMLYRSHQTSNQLMKWKKKIQKSLKTKAWISSLTNLSQKRQLVWIRNTKREKIHKVVIKSLLTRIRLRSDFPKLVSMALFTYRSQRRFDGQWISWSFSPVKQQQKDHYKKQKTDETKAKTDLWCILLLRLIKWAGINLLLQILEFFVTKSMHVKFSVNWFLSSLAWCRKVML